MAERDDSKEKHKLARKQVTFSVPNMPRLPKVRTPRVQIERRHRPKVAAIAIFLLVTLGVGFLGGWFGARASGGDGVASVATQREVVLNQSQLISTIAKQVSPSVVSVNVTGQQQSSGSYPSFFGYQAPQSQTVQAEGTGIIISSDGLIVTNRHVVPSGTTNVSVTLSDGTQLNNVEVVGRTNDNDSLDIAFLKITDTKGHKLVAAQLGDSSKMKVGDNVVAIGNALGQFQNTVTQGIISGFGRSIQAGDQAGSSSENLEDLFQTDAASNEGNSGGPLVNVNGEVIGINTAVAQQAQGIGFAIPINDVSGLIKSVLSSGKLEQPYLGVRYLTLTNDYAAQLNLKVNRGAYVLPSGQDSGQSGVVSGSPADKAGIKEGDVIQAVDGTNIDDSHSLTSLLDQHSVGDSVTLKVLRDGKVITVQATLDSAPTGQ
jgi:serine protease Do